MASPENVSGCANESWGRCLAVSNEPSLAYFSLFVPIGEIDGPGLATEPGKGCSATIDADAQEKCTGFEARTEEHNVRDESL